MNTNSQYEPLPALDNVYVVIVQEESHRNITVLRDDVLALGFAAQASHYDSITPTQPSSQSAAPGSVGFVQDRTSIGHPLCIYYSRPGHLYKNCFTWLGVNPGRGRGGKGHGRGGGRPTLVPTVPATAHQATAGPCTCGISNLHVRNSIAARLFH